MFKATLVFLFAIVAIQANKIQFPSKNLQEDANIKDIFDDIKKLLEELKTAIDKVTEKVKAGLEKLDEELFDLANKTISATKAAIDKETDVLFAKLDEIIEKAGDKDVQVCVDKYEPQLKALPDQLLDELVLCINEKIEEGESIILGVYDAIDEVYQEISNLEKEVDECGTGVDAVVCLTKLVAKITEDVTTLPAKVTAAYVEAETLINTLLPEIEACAAGKVAQLSLDGGKILVQIEKCIADL